MSGPLSSSKHLWVHLGAHSWPLGSGSAGPHAQWEAQGLAESGGGGDGRGHPGKLGDWVDSQFPMPKATLGQKIWSLLVATSLSY